MLAVTIAATAGVVAAPGRPALAAEAAAAVGSNLDIVFAIDGSSSIDGSDFTTEKRAIVAALRDPVLFPVDGATSVGVVQWAGGQTRTEFARTALSAAADVDAATSAVEGMAQLGGGTNTGEGIQAAAALLQGATAARQTVCVATDGVNNTGLDPTSAAAAAKAAGIDRIAFATLEDGSAFTEATAKAAYSAVAVDADVVHSRSPAEFSAVLPTACLRPPVSVIATEVTQGVQDWTNSVPLVAKRPTFVRAFVEPASGGPSYAAGLRLRGYRDGQELPGSPLVALNAGGSLPLAPNVTARRGDPAASLNFRLPDDWVNGSTKLQVDAVGAVADCHERCEATADYRVTSMPEVTFVNVPYRSGLSIRNASDSELDEQAGQVFSAYPISDLTYRTGHFLLPALTKPTVFQTVPRLRVGRTLDGCWGGCDRIYYGVLPGSADDGDALGLANGTNTAAGFIGKGDPYDRNTAPHEIGHLLGRPHAVKPGTSGTPALHRGVCGETADSGAEDYPFFSSVDGEERAVLGPLDSPDTEIWGIDIRAFPGNPTLGVIDPRKDFELMSYCAGSAQGTWPGSHTWKKLTEKLGGGSGTGGGGGGGWKADTPVLAVQGQVNLTTGAVTLEPNAVVTSTFEPATSAGDWALVQKAATGAVISTTPFALDMIEAKQAPGSTTPLPSVGTFSVPVPYASTLKSLQIMHGGSVVAQRTASAHAPVITITAPAQGATLSGDTDVSWTAEDADKDPLSYTVQYSADGGQTWTTLSAFQTDSHLLVPEGTLAGSTQGAFRVLASDGFASTSASVSFLHVPDVAPRVTISSPQAGAVFSGAQPVTLSAVAQDQEDGPLPDDRITWTSDRDGVIGHGASTSVSASQLTEGTQELTVTATDSAGATRTASVTIKVQRIATPVNQPPSVGALTLTPPAPTAGQAASLAVAFTDADTEAHTVATDWGDGTPVQTITTAAGVVSASMDHSWATAGSYTVNVQVSDGTATAEGTLAVKVSAAGPLCLGRAPTIVVRPSGSPQHGVIRGTTKDDVILGSKRDDRIEGGGGNDVICGGGGDDAIRGGTGADIVDGGSGRDEITGDRGDDVLDGAAGRDHVSGGSGNDTLSGGDSADRLWGDSGNDTLTGGRGRDYLSGGRGNDTLYGDEGNDRLLGDDGNDQLFGGPGRDRLDGGRGRDTEVQ